MIQINVQAILDKSSEAMILSSINAIRSKINGDPIILKVTTDSSALNSLTSKIRTLTNSVEKPIKLNIDSSAMNKTTDSFKIFDIAGQKVEKLIGTTRQYTDALGQTVTVAEKFKTVMNGTGTGFEKITSTPIITYGNNLEATRIKAEKLILTQDKLRASMANLGSMPISAKPLAQNAESLVTGLNVGSSPAELEKAKLAVLSLVNAHKELLAVQRLEGDQTQAISQATAKYNQLFAEIRAGATSVKLTEEQMTLLQQKLNAISVNPRALTQLTEIDSLMASMRSESNIQFVTDRNLENTRLENAELQKQIALFVERNALAVRNLQAQFGSTAQTPSVQQSLGAINASTSGLSTSATTMAELRTQTTAINTQLSTVRTGLSETVSASNTLGNSILGNLGKMLMWGMAATAIYAPLRMMQSAVTYVNDLDNALNQIRIVTGQSQPEVQKLAESYNALGKAMSVSTVDVANTSVDLYRQGLQGPEVEERMQAIVKYSKISAISMADSNKIITATMNATGESAQKVIDTFSYLGDATASGADEIGVAMQKVASMNDGIGVSMQKAASWVAEISSKTREGASQIGTSLKSIESRYSSIKEKGFNSEDATNMNQVVQALTKAGVVATTADGQLRNFGEVVDDLGGKFGGLDAKTQNYVMTTLGGTYQMNRLRALMNGYADSVDLYNKSLDQTGIANQKFDIWTESTGAKVERLTSTVQGFFSAIASSNVIKGMIDSLTYLISSFGNLQTILSVVGTVLLAWKGTAILSFFQTLPLKIQTAIMNLQLFKDISIANTMVASGEITALQGLSLSFNSLGIAIKSAFLSNPLGWIAIGVTSAVMAMDMYNQKQEEAAQKSKESADAFKQQQTEITSLIATYKQNAELAKTDDNAKIQLIETEKKLKDIFGESANALNLQSGSIDDNIKKIRELGDEKQKDFIRENSLKAQQGQDGLNKKQFLMGSDVSGVISDYADKSVVQAKGEYNVQEEINAIRSAMDNIGKTGQGKEFLQTLTDELERLKTLKTNADNLSAMVNTSNKEIVQNSIEGLDKLSEQQRTTFTDIQGKMTFTNADQYKNNLNAVKDILLKWDGKNIDDLNASLNKVDSSLPPIVNKIGIAKNATDGFALSVSNLQKTMATSATKIADAKGALDEFDKTGSFNVDTLIKLGEKHQELIPILGNEKATHQALIDIIATEEEASRQAYAQMLMGSEDFYTAKVLGNAQTMDALSKLYNGDLTQYKSLAEAKSKVDQELIMHLASLWGNYYRAGKLVAKPLDGGRTVVGADGKEQFITPEMKAQYAGLKEYSDQMTALETAMNGIALKGTSGIDFSKIGMTASNTAQATADAKKSKADKALADKEAKAKASADKKALADAQKQADAVAKAQEKVAIATKRLNDAKTISQKESALDALNVANANLEAVNKAGATAESIAQARTAAINADASKASTNAIAEIARVQKATSDAIIAGYQKQIDAINTKVATETRATQQLQYQNDLIKQQNDLTNAQNQKNVRIFQDGKWQWQADQTAVQSARDTMSTTQKESTKFNADNAIADLVTALNLSIKTEQDAQALREKSASASMSGYASGTSYARSGVKKINEEGIEIIVGNKAEFQGGEQVINASDTSKILNGSANPVIAPLNNMAQSVSSNANLVTAPLNALLFEVNASVQKFVDATPKYARDSDNNIGKSITDNDILIKRPLDMLIADITNSIQHFVDISPQFGKDIDKNIGDSVTANNALLITPITILVDAVRTGINKFVAESYNSGTGIVDELGKGVTDSTANIVDIVKTLTDKVVEQFQTSFGIHSPSVVMYKIGEFLMQGLTNGISSSDVNSFIQSKFTEMATSGKSAIGGAVSGNVQDWIAEAIKATGIDPSNAGALEQMAMHESSGDPGAINNWDSNAMTGHPSQGLMQTIPSTFNAYKMEGHGDILNPIDNAIAAINYMIARYGSVNNVPGVKALTRGKNYVGYASGTEYVPKDGVYRINEDNKSEIVTLPQGAGVIKNSLTKNLMDWGKFNPNNFLKSILPTFKMPELKFNNQNQTAQKSDTYITVQNVELPNVSDSEGFINSIMQLGHVTA